MFSRSYKGDIGLSSETKIKIKIPSSKLINIFKIKISCSNTMQCMAKKQNFKIFHAFRQILFFNWIYWNFSISFWKIRRAWNFFKKTRIERLEILRHLFQNYKFRNPHRLCLGFQDFKNLKYLIDLTSWSWFFISKHRNFEIFLIFFWSWSQNSGHKFPRRSLK